MKKLLKDYWKILVIFSIPYFFIVISFFVKVNYDVTVPASISSVSNVIEVGKNDSNSINTVSVYSYSRVNLLGYLMAKCNPYATVSETYKYEITDNKVSYSSGLVQKKVSIYNAIIAGYKAAGHNEIVNDESFKGYIIHTLYTYSPRSLQIGDIVTGFDGIKFDKYNGTNEFSKVLNSIIHNEEKEYEINVTRIEVENDTQVSKEYTFMIKPGATYEKVTSEKTDIMAVFGISTYAYLVPRSMSNSLIDYSWSFGDTIGPSGGLMQSLYVYSALTNFNLTKNLKIVGTGTVDSNGKAGAIGGIYQKVITADLSGADIFFVPVSSLDYEIYSKESNYLEAKASYDALSNTKMKLVVVSSLDDVINYLKNYKGE